MLSKTGSFLHNQTLVFRQEQLPDFPLLWKPQGPQLPSSVCARCAFLMQTALSSGCVSLHLRARCWAGRKIGNAAFFSIGMHRQWGSESLDIPVICRLTVLMLDGTTQALCLV